MTEWWPLRKLIVQLDAEIARGRTHWTSMSPMADMKWSGSELYRVAMETGLVATKNVPRPLALTPEGPSRSAMGGSVPPMTLAEPMTMVEVPADSAGWQEFIDALCAVIRLTDSGPAQAQRP